MSYVLVCLAGDENTQKAAEFADWMATYHPPSAFFREEAPAHESVAAAVGATNRAMIVGHNGEHCGEASLRAKAAGPAWANAKRLGQTFSGARVYAYACLTMGGAPFAAALGKEAKDAGVAAFAGHASVFDSGWEDNVGSEGALEPIRKAVAQLIIAFLEGENDAAKLKLAARESFDMLSAGFSVDDPAGAVALLVVPMGIQYAVEYLAIAS
jgi:hypothetical protein